jgi:hypothetical protein
LLLLEPLEPLELGVLTNTAFQIMSVNRRNCNNFFPANRLDWYFRGGRGIAAADFFIGTAHGATISSASQLRCLLGNQKTSNSLGRVKFSKHNTTKFPEEPPLEFVQLLKIGYATIYEDASPSRREGREIRAGRGSM